MVRLLVAVCALSIVSSALGEEASKAKVTELKARKTQLKEMLKAAKAQQLTPLETMRAALVAHATEKSGEPRR